MTASHRTLVIAEFAQLLSDIRRSAGQPSFRQMAQTSGCISHATLHEAMRGKRLPTWETTEQFLIACKVDPLQWRDEWRRADHLIGRSSSQTQDINPVRLPRPEAGEAVVRDASPEELEELAEQERQRREGSTQPMLARPEPATLSVPIRMPFRGKQTRRSTDILIGAVAAAALVTTGFVAARSMDGGPETPAAATSSAASSSASPATQPKPATPEVSPSGSAQDCPAKGSRWSARFNSKMSGVAVTVSDGHVPQCSKIEAGSTRTKGFLLTNSGTVSWSKWTMRRSDKDPMCGGDRTIGLPNAAPGTSLAMSFDVSATNGMGSGMCTTTWELLDANGTPVLDQPIVFRVVVDTTTASYK